MQYKAARGIAWVAAPQGQSLLRCVWKWQIFYINTCVLRIHIRGEWREGEPTFPHADKTQIALHFFMRHD